MADNPKAYKTTITLVVISPDPISLDFAEGDAYEPLNGLIYDITEGDKIGDWSVDMTNANVPLEGEALQRELIAIGNDGTFFDPL